jgi:hypothetical protein
MKYYNILAALMVLSTVMCGSELKLSQMTPKMHEVSKNNFCKSQAQDTVGFVECVSVVEELRYRAKVKGLDEKIDASTFYSNALYKDRDLLDTIVSARDTDVVINYNKEVFDSEQGMLIKKFTKKINVKEFLGV